MSDDILKSLPMFTHLDISKTYNRGSIALPICSLTDEDTEIQHKWFSQGQTTNQ